MSVKLLTEHHLEFLNLKGAQARLSLHLSKCHVGNHLTAHLSERVETLEINLNRECLQGYNWWVS